MDDRQPGHVHHQRTGRGGAGDVLHRVVTDTDVRQGADGDVGGGVGDDERRRRPGSGLHIHGGGEHCGEEFLSAVRSGHPGGVGGGACGDGGGDVRRSTGGNDAACCGFRSPQGGAAD